MTLTDVQIDRYSRQIIVPRIGGRGQERILAARMILVGDARDLEAPRALRARTRASSWELEPPLAIVMFASRL